MTPISKEQIDKDYIELVDRVEMFMTEIQARQEQERVEEEEREKMRMLREMQVRPFLIYLPFIWLGYRKKSNVKEKKKLKESSERKQKKRSKRLKKRKGINIFCNKHEICL